MNLSSTFSRLARLRRWLRGWKRRPRPDTRAVTTVCQRAAAGDLEARMIGADANTDFGRMCHAINGVLDLADSFVREASAAMDNCSRDRFHRPILLRGLKGSYKQSAAIINAAGLKMLQSSENFQFVQKQAAENADNVQRVAAACEQLSATTGEISGQTEQAAKTARDAVTAVETISASLQALALAIGKVDRIVEVINDVVMQTNLLALNASIEAAHAAEHGLGFAVVASEVKALSNNTHRATEEIADEVRHARAAAARVGELFAQIQATIAGVHDTAASIALSTGQQMQATTEISNTIMEVAKNSDEVSLLIARARA